MNGLTLLYNFQSPQTTEGDFRPASYKVIYFFSEQGLIEQSTLRELCKSVPDANYNDLTFLNLEDLRVFAQRVSQETESSEVRLMSVLDYNIGLDGARDREGFLSILSKFGEVLSNAQAKKKGFLGKFFN
jgi:hypothetical protein